MVEPAHIYGLDALHLGLGRSLLDGGSSQNWGPARVASGGAGSRSGMIGSA